MHGRCLSPIASLPFDGCCVLSSMCRLPRPNSSDHCPTPRRPRRSLSLSTPYLHPPAPPVLRRVSPPPPFGCSVNDATRSSDPVPEPSSATNEQEGVETKSHGTYVPSSRAYEYAQKNVTWKDTPRQQPSSHGTYVPSSRAYEYARQSRELRLIN